LNSQPAASQPYPLATRVPECRQSFTSFLVIHFHFAYFPICLFRQKQYEMMFKTIRNGVLVIASYIRPTTKSPEQVELVKGKFVNWH